EVRLELTGKDLHRSTLPNPVRPEDPGHLSLDRHGEAVEGEPVLAVAVGGVLEFLGKADDIECLEGALFDADPAAHTELLGYERLSILPDNHCLVARPHSRAVDDALGTALPRVAPVLVDDCNPHTR